MRSLFVYNPADMHADTPGGVQRCTSEFRDVVAAASSSVTEFAVSIDRRLITRLKRRTRMYPYHQYAAGEHSEALRAAAADVDAVFLNRAELIDFAECVRTVAPHAHPIVLSHGNESGDLVYEIAIARARQHGNLLKRVRDFLWLGGDIVAETRARHAGALTVCAMSEEEAVIERWLGANDTLVLPRVIDLKPIVWCPNEFRAGYVGSLHHTPNIVALEAIFLRLAATGPVSVDLVGSPAHVGLELASRFPFVIYHGPLPDDRLTELASKWSIFLNPIFWLSKGASMKLAQGLGWGLPVLTTFSGRRGYELPVDCVISVADNAAAFVEALQDIAQDPARASTARQNLLRSSDALPTAESLGIRLRSHLETLFARRRATHDALAAQCRAAQVVASRP